jgi:hypothetical protein
MRTKTVVEQRRVVSTWLSRSQHEQLAELAREGDRSLSAQVRRLVLEHLQRDVPSA